MVLGIGLVEVMAGCAPGSLGLPLCLFGVTVDMVVVVLVCLTCIIEEDFYKPKELLV